MCEVTKYNFENLYNEIEESFKKAVFISIDCEFSALHINNAYKGSLFDSPSQRYRKMRKNLENAIPLEIGLTAYSFDRDAVVFKAKPYKFYLFPAYFGVLDRYFICQSSAFHFLGEHKFDFNKFVYSGVPYLNTDRELEILKHIDNNDLYEYCQFSLENIGIDTVRRHTTVVCEWFYKNQKENQKTVFDISVLNRSLTYILHRDLRARFLEKLWTYEEDQQFKVRRVDPEEFNNLTHNCPLEAHLISSLLGFTRIFRLLTSLEKPIVGHNCLHDLVIIINTFHNPVPDSYTAFKKLVNKFFPVVFDTKTLCFELLRTLPNENKFKGTGLPDLYNHFKNEAGRHLVAGSPRIEISDGFNTYTADKFHDAGWDAYCTGYCFIRIAHYFAVRNLRPIPNQKQKVFMSSEYLKAIDGFKNQVNIIRATIPYLNLSGADPASQRPPCLIIQSTTRKPVDIFKVTELLREYGSVDIKPYSCQGRRAIVAVPNYGSARRILGRFQDQEEFQVFTYNAIKHSPAIRASLWVGAIASGGILAWLLHSQIVKS